MFKNWQKIMIFQIAAAIFAALPATAQTFASDDPTVGVNGQIRGIESKDVLTYAKDNEIKSADGYELKDILGNTEKVFCGEKTRTCNRSNQVCWSCHVKARLLIYKEDHEYGVCLPKSYSDADARKSAEEFCWGMGNLWFDKGWGGDIWVTKRSDGFLAQDETKLLWIIKLDDNEEERTFIGKGPDGKEHKYLLAYDQGNPTLKYADGGNTEGCEVLPIKLNKMSGCFFCPLARVIFETANDAAELSFGLFASSFQNLIVIAFAVWLAFASLNIVFTFTKQDASKYITSIIKQGGKFMFAYFLLAYPQDLFNLFISPILSTGLEMGDKIKAFDKALSLSDMGADYVAKKAQGEYFAAGGIYNKIELFLIGVQQQLAVLQAIGSSLFCIGGNEITWQNLVGKGTIMYSLRAYFLGAILFLFGLLLTVAFAFYFMDGLLQLSILGAMLPMMIAGWPFKVTAKYATDGLKMLLNTTFIMFFTGFVVSVELNLIGSALEYVNTKSGMDVKSGAGLNGMFNAINSQNNDDIRKLVDIGGKGFLLIIFAAIFGFKFVAQVPKLANKLAGGVNLGISSKVATMMASSAKGTALKATKPLRKSASAWWHEGGGLIGRVARVGKIPGALIKGGNALAHRAGMKNTWVDRFQNSLNNAAKRHEELAREASLKGGLGNRISQKWHERLAKSASATAEHGVIGGLSARVEQKAKEIHQSYQANEEYNESRRREDERSRRHRGESTDE